MKDFLDVGQGAKGTGVAALEEGEIEKSSSKEENDPLELLEE